MNKLLILLLVLKTSISFSQIPNDVFTAKYPSGFNWSTTTLNTVTDIASCSTARINTLFITDTIRGGAFTKYTGANPVDNGMIFQDANGQKWIRQTNTDYIDIRWFGAKNDGSDSRSAIISAINSATVTFPKKRVYVFGEFYSSDSVNINSTIEIFGEGNESKIRFAAHKTGLTFTYPGSQYAKLTNISIIGDAGTAGNPVAWDRSKHGIVVKSPVDFNGVWVRYFDGCGIYIVNDLTSSPPGNSNTSMFNDCHVYENMLHGIFIKGGDANTMTFINCDVVSNGGVGIYDKSFLGNSYAYNHVASNGSPELSYQRGLVKSSGTVYACIKDTTINVAPPNATYWQDVGTAWLAYSNVLNYNAATTYYAVSSIILEGSNQYGTSTSNYIESDQAPGYIDQNNININGNIQTRNTTPTTIYASLGKIRSKASFVGEYGISSSWLYGGDMGNYINGYTSYPNYSGLIVGGNAKSSLIKFYDNFTDIGQFYTSTNTFNTFLESGKKYVITADTTNIVGTLLNNGAEISAGGITQMTLDDSTAALRASAASLYQPLNSNLTTIGGLASTTDNFIVGVSSAWNVRTPTQVKTILGATTVGNNLFTLPNPSAISFIRVNADNTATSRTASEMRTDLSLVPGTNVLAPTGDGSGLIGITGSQISGNISGSAGSVVNSLSIAAELISGGASSYNGSAAKSIAIQSNSVTNSMLSQISTGTFKGRTTAGSGNVEDLTATQATAILNGFTGDSGSGGIKGLVPAPAAGDGAANKVLLADGTWGTISGSGQTFKQTLATNFLRIF